MVLINVQMEGEAAVELMEKILSQRNLEEAIKAVKSNKGAPGVDKMTVDEIDAYFEIHMDEVKTSIMKKKYKPLPVRRVYIPKPNGGQRPLGIPSVKDRVIQQAVAQVLNEVFDKHFSEHSYGFRPERSAHGAIEEVLYYMNDGCEWVVDLDIEKFFDKVNHDKLISIIRERVKDDVTLNLLRKFLQAGVLDDGLVSPSEEGVPQGGPLSPILSNIYLDKFDKELESRGLRFVRYADDVNIFVKSEMAANRVMKSVCSWLERKMFLKVSATKTKVVQPPDSTYLGFTFWKDSDKEIWKCKPADSRKKRLYKKIQYVLCRKRASAMKLAVVFKKVNEIVRGWINYFRIGSMKMYITKLGQWLRHKIRVIILKQWKSPRTIFKNLVILNRIGRANFSTNDLLKFANARQGLYSRARHRIINYLLPPNILGMRKADRPGLVNPLIYYLSN